MGNKKTGFTLIELLVVIAVIGILSSTLLIGYTGVRDKAKDARAISGMSQLRVAAESFYSKDNTYDGLSTDGNVAAIVGDIQDQVKPNTVTFAYSTSKDKYCALVSLNDNTKYCVDSTARAVKGTGVSCSAGACSGS